MRIDGGFRVGSGGSFCCWLGLADELDGDGGGRDGGLVEVEGGGGQSLVLEGHLLQVELGFLGGEGRLALVVEGVLLDDGGVWLSVLFREGHLHHAVEGHVRHEWMLWLGSLAAEVLFEAEEVGLQVLLLLRLELRLRLDEVANTRLQRWLLGRCGLVIGVQVWRRVRLLLRINIGLAVDVWVREDRWRNHGLNEGCTSQLRVDNVVLDIWYVRRLGRRIAGGWGCRSMIVEQPLQLLNFILFYLVVQYVEQLLVKRTHLRLRRLVPEVELRHVLLLERRRLRFLARGVALHPCLEVQVQLLLPTALCLRQSWRLLESLEASMPLEVT